MALRSTSLFLYNLQVTTLNRSLDFRATSGGPILQATLNLGYYSLTDLMNEIIRALEAADPNHTYTVTANRTISGGTQNRVTISTSGTYLDLLFASGPRAASSVDSLIGFAHTDRTGSTSYTGTSSAGTVLQSTLYGYNYLSTDHMRKVFGALNVSASGQKEAIVFQIQKFIQVQFKYEPTVKFTNEWVPFLTWAIQQRSFDFTPEVNSPSVFYNVTLEKTGADGKGLAYTAKEMLPDFPFLYDIGVLTFRLKV